MLTSLQLVVDYNLQKSVIYKHYYLMKNLSEDVITTQE